MGSNIWPGAEKGSCIGVDPFVANWFPEPPPKNMTLYKREYDRLIEAAIKICWTCPVRQECEDYSIEHQIEDGVWGGWTEQERALMLPQNPPELVLVLQQIEESLP